MRKVYVRTAWVSSLVLVFLCLGLRVRAADPVWHTTLEAARTAASPLARQVLVFFPGEGQLAQANDRLLRDAGVVAKLAPRFEFCRIEFAQNRDLAMSLGVYKVGAIAVCDAAGRPAKVIMESLSSAQLVELLSGGAAASTDVQPSPVSGAGASTPIAARPSATAPNAPIKHPKGALVAGPLLISATKPAHQDVCMLQKGKKYVLVVEGVFGVWAEPRNRGADACFLYESPRSPGQIRSGDLVYTVNPDASLADLIRTETGAAPVYSPLHVYEAVVTGQGAMLRMMVKDKDYKDNSGDFMMRVYELP